MHSKRLIVAVIVLPLLYLYINYLHPIYFFVLILCASILAQAEFYSMYRTDKSLRFIGTIIGITCLVSIYLRPLVFKDILVIGISFFFVFRMLKGHTPSGSLTDISAAVIGVLYIPGLLCYQVLLRQMGKENIFLLYASVWSADSLAYYVGKSIGRHKLYEAVSPKKTVEGAVGSLIGGMAGALLIRYIFPDLISTKESLLTGIILGGVSIIGDLVESMFKRDAGVKDSGVVFPGHGGILDKIDGALIAAPVLYILRNL